MMKWLRALFGLHQHVWVLVAVWHRNPDHSDCFGERWDGAMMEMCRHCAKPRHFPGAHYDAIYNGEPADLFSLLCSDQSDSSGRWVPRLGMVAEFEGANR